MEPLAIGIIGVVICFALIFLGAPIPVATIAVSVVGVFWLYDAHVLGVVLKLFGYTLVADFSLSVIPLFVLMGLILFYCGVGEEIFTAVRNWVGHFRGGLAIATTAACAAFGTCTGSSQATAAIMAKIAYPEMRKAGYQPELAFGVVAASGTIAAMIPPSITIVLYGVIARLGVGKVLIAGFTGGIVSALIYMVMIVGRVMLNPSLASSLSPPPWRPRLISLRYLVPPIIMFLILIGGMYIGVFTPTEAGGMAAVVAFMVALATRRLTWARLRESLLETIQVTLMVLILFVGIVFFTRFLCYSRVIIAFVNLALSFPSPLITLVLMFAIYVILGMFLGTLGMLMITTPVFLPAAVALGYDPIWFGIIAIKMCEIAWITPPVALNVYVAQALIKELPLERAFKAVIPFLVCDILTLILFIAFPQVILFLPNMMAD